jgi:hypothetical protein
MLPPKMLFHFTQVRVGVYCGPVLRHSAEPIQAANFRSAVASRAIQKFVGSFEATHPDFEKFSEWAMQKGYTNKPMTEKAK